MKTLVGLLALHWSGDHGETAILPSTCGYNRIGMPKILCRAFRPPQPIVPASTKLTFALFVMKGIADVFRQALAPAMVARITGSAILEKA
jgi:hypothetical protein